MFKVDDSGYFTYVKFALNSIEIDLGGYNENDYKKFIDEVISDISIDDEIAKHIVRKLNKDHGLGLDLEDM